MRVAWLMVGRTPEYLRKRIGGREMTQVALCYLATPFVLLAGAAIAIALPGERLDGQQVGLTFLPHSPSAR